jgi:Raf kinase inhibitor-like YbhB/YbcL family protein
MELKSTAFAQGKKIPARFTCQGENISPPLSIHHVPKDAQSLILIMDDPDVPAFVRKDCMYDHWVVYNIPPTTHTFPEGVPPPGIQGKNTNGQNKYTGPCPPDREHRYFFKLYALSKMLHLPPGATKKEVEHAMQGSILAECSLMGRYEKHA